MFTSGAIKLSILDGDKMQNWIISCHLKKYYTLLVQEQLQNLNEEKWRKQKNQLKESSRSPKPSYLSPKPYTLFDTLNIFLGI